MREAVVRGNGPILLLAWTAGYLNALSFLGLRVFTANMTGNTVLLGLAVAQLDRGALLRTLTSMVGFCVGAFGGTFIVARRCARPGRSWTPRITLALFIESCLLLIFAVIWFLTREVIQSNESLLEHFPQLATRAAPLLIQPAGRRAPEWAYPALLDHPARWLGNKAWRYMQWTRRNRPAALARVAFVRATMRPYALFEE